MLFSEWFYELQPGIWKRTVESRQSMDVMFGASLRTASAERPSTGYNAHREAVSELAAAMRREERKQEMVGSELDIFI